MLQKKVYDFAIGIPTINRKDLLEKALERYAKNFPDVEILIIDNGNQDIKTDNKNTIIWVQENNIGVAASWNLICKRLFKRYKWSIILNDDVEIDNTQQELNNFFKSNQHISFFKSRKEWSIFGLNKYCYETVGEFDEKFYPAYFEDNDYWRRMQLKGIRTAEKSTLNPVIYRNSMSIEKEPALNKHFMDNRHYYINKWGGQPGNEKFDIPFGL